MGTRKVDIYSYTAASNPFLCRNLAHKYGYEYDADQRPDTVLRQLVAFEGEPALMDVVKNHPDLELFREYFSREGNELKDDKKGAVVTDTSRLLENYNYMNFTGQLAAVQQTSENRQLTQNTSLMVLAGAVLIAFAIISTKK